MIKQKDDKMGVNYSQRLERAKSLFLRSNKDDENKRKIIEFIDHLIANDLSPARQLKYFYTLKTIYNNFNKTFTQANKKRYRRISRLDKQLKI